MTSDSEIQIEGVVASHFEQRNQRDQKDLARTGKRQILKRRFGVISMLGMTSTLMATWEGVLAYFVSGLTNGGPAGLVWSFLITWIGVFSVICCLGELTSMAPTAGGEYYWVSILAPKSYSKFLSYVTGWLSVAVWQGFVANSGFLCGTFIQGLIILNYPESYDPKGWHGTLLFWATMLFAVFANTILTRWLPGIEGLILYLHVIGFFAIIIPLIYTAEHSSATTVFTEFLSGGGYPTIGLSVMVGADCACHLSEEVFNASRVVPWNMIITMIVNGVLGFFMLITALFCVGDLKDDLETATGYPFMQVFYDATKSKAGTTLMVCIPLILSYAAILAQFATASRQMWSFARDRGLPGWKQLSSVDPKTTLPLWSIAATCVISMLIALINIGSTEALINIIGFITAAWLAATLIPLILLFWRRVTGAIKSFAGSDGVFSTIDVGTLQWGDWRMSEPFGTLVNGFAIAWNITMLVFATFPIAVPATAKNMNYSSLMTGFWIIFSIVYYFVWGRKIYKGPVIDLKLG